MTILIDDREGSKELLPYFPAGVAQITRLGFGDVAFTGKGPDGVPHLVGIERKRFRDMLNSLESGRFAGHQLPGMLRSYNTSYLFVEGVWRTDKKSGLLEIPDGNRGWTTGVLGNKRIMGSRLWNFLQTVEQMVGVHTRTVDNVYEFVQVVTFLYQWWNKEWDEHDSLNGIYKPDIVSTSTLTPPNLVARVASELPGIGPKRAIAASKVFPNVRGMILATEKEWAAVDGVGKETARKVVKSIG